MAVFDLDFITTLVQNTGFALNENGEPPLVFSTTNDSIDSDTALAVNFDVSKVTDTVGSGVVTLERGLLTVDSSLAVDVTDLDMNYNMTDPENPVCNLNEGYLSYDFDFNFELVTVISSTTPDIKGGKIVITAEINLNKAGINLAVLPICDIMCGEASQEQIYELINSLFSDLSILKCTVKVYDNSNSKIYECTITYSDIINGAF